MIVNPSRHYILPFWWPTWVTWPFWQYIWLIVLGWHPDRAGIINSDPLYNGLQHHPQTAAETLCQELCDRMIAGSCYNKKQATMTLISWEGTWKCRSTATVMICWCLPKSRILVEKWLSIDTPQSLITGWLCSHKYTVVCCCLTNQMGVQTDLLHSDIWMKQIHLDPHQVS